MIKETIKPLTDAGVTTIYLGSAQGQELYDYYMEQKWFSGEEVTAKRMKRMIAHGIECPWPKECRHGVPDRWPKRDNDKLDNNKLPKECFQIHGAYLVLVRHPSMLQGEK